MAREVRERGVDRDWGGAMASTYNKSKEKKAVAKVKEKVDYNKQKRREAEDRVREYEKERKYEKKKEDIPSQVQKQAEEREKLFGEEYKKNEEFLGTTKEAEERQRKAQQYEAYKNARRSRLDAERRLLGEQSQRGVRGGVAYAQRRNLAELENQAVGEAHRAMDKQSYENALKKQAANIALTQGNLAQREADRQRYEDELRYQDEQRRQRKENKRFVRALRRI